MPESWGRKEWPGGHFLWHNWELKCSTWDYSDQSLFYHVELETRACIFCPCKNGWKISDSNHCLGLQFLSSCLPRVSRSRQSLKARSLVKLPANFAVICNIPNRTIGSGPWAFLFPHWGIPQITWRWRENH